VNDVFICSSYLTEGKLDFNTLYKNLQYENRSDFRLSYHIFNVYLFPIENTIDSEVNIGDHLSVKIQTLSFSDFLNDIYLFLGYKSDLKDSGFLETRRVIVLFRNMT
jgi:hypothetical protein